MITISVHTNVFGMFCIHVPHGNYFDKQLSWLRNSATPLYLDYRPAISFYLQLIIIIFDLVAPSTVWTAVFWVFYHHWRTSRTALDSGVGTTNMFEPICRVVSGDKLVHCTEIIICISPAISLMSVSVSRASLWQCHGNRTSSFLKASDYPVHTTTQTQRFNIHPPQRLFSKKHRFQG